MPHFQNVGEVSRVTRENLNGQATSSIYDGVGNMLSCVYPSGRTMIIGGNGSGSGQFTNAISGTRFLLKYQRVGAS